MIYFAINRVSKERCPLISKGQAVLRKLFFKRRKKSCFLKRIRIRVDGAPDQRKDVTKSGKTSAHVPTLMTRRRAFRLSEPSCLKNHHTGHLSPFFSLSVQCTKLNDKSTGYPYLNSFVFENSYFYILLQISMSAKGIIDLSN